jgi:ketosteroid isomerase-like protein
MQHEGMRARISPTLTFCLLACFATNALAQQKSDAQTVRALEAKWVDAYKRRQIATLSSLLAVDFVITVEDGSTFSKVGFISYNAGALQVDVAEMSDLNIRMHGNIAVVTGAYHEQGESHGKLYDYRDRLTDVWMKNSGGWQLIASHYSLPVKL